MQKLAKGLDLSREDIRRVLAITLPALFELVLSQLFTMVDTIMLGRPFHCHHPICDLH